MKRLFYSLLLVLPQLSWAQATFDCPRQGPTLFQYPCSDASIRYLGKIFGNVGQVLEGVSGNTLFQQMFSVFNATVLSLGGIIVLYTLFLGVLKTAHEGETLGRQWSSIWIPMRTALGVAFLVPAKASGGYSFIQVFMVWVAIQGAGAADQLWTRVLDYYRQGGTATPVVSVDVGIKLNVVFTSMVCMYSLDRSAQMAAQNTGGTGSTSAAAPTEPTVKPELQGNAYVFNVPGYAGKCGSVGWSTVGNQAMVDGRKAATAQLVLGLMPMAQQLVFQPEKPRPSNLIDQVGLKYRATINEAVQRAGGAESLGFTQDVYNEAFNNGWLFAGAYFREITLANDRQSAIMGAPPIATGPDTGYFGNPNNFAPPSSDVKKAQFNADIKRAQDYLSAQSFGTSKIQLYTDKGSPGGVMGAIMGALNNALAGAFVSIAESFSGASPGQEKTTNPMFAMQRFGMILLTVVQAVWIGIAAVLMILTLAVSGWGFFILPNLVAGINVVLWILSFITPILGIMFTSGVMLGFYIPLMPFIIFTMGALGWLSMVIESLVAAPIVALGVINPEGHDVMGKAQNAVLLIAQVFLRPSLMIFALIAAMMLSYVVVDMINGGFGRAFGSLYDTTEAGIVAFTSILSFMALIIVYVTFIMTAVKKTFSLISSLPVDIWQWVGGQGRGFGEEQILQAVESGTREAAGAVGQSGQKAADAGIQAGQSKIKGMREAAGKKGGGKIGRGRPRS